MLNVIFHANSTFEFRTKIRILWKQNNLKFIYPKRKCRWDIIVIHLLFDNRLWLSCQTTISKSIFYLFVLGRYQKLFRNEIRDNWLITWFLWRRVFIITYFDHCPIAIGFARIRMSYKFTYYLIIYHMSHGVKYLHTTINPIEISSITYLRTIWIRFTTLFASNLRSNY